MDPLDLLKRNHDLHLHSREFSDGWHTLDEVTAYGLRWQVAERWVGISEHSPLDSLDVSLRGSLRKLRSVQPQLEQHNHARVLIGLELDWELSGVRFSLDALTGFDYILAAYHGRQLTNPLQARAFLLKMVEHPFTDILAHPDVFLGVPGALDPGQMASTWRVIFQTMAELGVLCEYNLTTPLNEDAFRIARDESGVKFIIASDLHDFRCSSTRRIMDAWGESQGGGYTRAQQYLLELIELGGSDTEQEPWYMLFASPDALAELEARIYTRTRRYGAQEVPINPAEASLLRYLDELPEGQVDLAFQAARFERFASLPVERIASLLGAVAFLELMQRGGELRAEKQALR